ncbi:lactosylceramide 4-alpha-galactosyltransferase-like isoform X3 [Ornithodoros turicata]|uniref:lactosylceramide 4-alpha-galactosyltransferase-like isoform X3 n=1 Tax=Ornithodoros turicata TaxID=34597 RepID=UPI003138A21D
MPENTPKTLHGFRKGPKPALFCGILILVVLTYVTFWNSNLLFNHLHEINRAAESSLDEGTGSGFFMFIETAGHDSLNARQACAIESASLHHPTFTVRFFVTAPPSNSCTYFNLLRQISNIKIKFVNVEQVLAGTPLEYWYRSPQRQQSPFAVSHLSDALRFFMLWRYGGIYADTDVIVKSPMSGLRNTLGKEHAAGMGSAVLVLDREQPFLADAVHNFAETYQPYDWDYNGPGLLNRMLQKRCPGAWNVTDASLTCGNITVLSSSAFFAVPFPMWEMFFNLSRTEEVLQVTRNSYAVHFWNNLSKNTKVIVGSGAAYDVLARTNCPKVYEVMRTMGYF